MKIAQLDSFIVSVPYRWRENSARVRRDGVSAVLVRLETEEGLVPIVMMTHKVLEGDMNAALAAIAALDTVDNSIMRIRVETLDA